MQLVSNLRILISLGLFAETGGDRNWTTLQGDVESVAVVGIPGLTVEVTTFAVEVNLEASDETVIDYTSRTTKSILVVVTAFRSQWMRHSAS